MILSLLYALVSSSIKQMYLTLRTLGKTEIIHVRVVYTVPNPE